MGLWNRVFTSAHQTMRANAFPGVSPRVWQPPRPIGVPNFELGDAVDSLPQHFWSDQGDTVVGDMKAPRSILRRV